MAMLKYVHRTELKEGMLVMADGGFRCMGEHETFRVQQDNEGRFFVQCHCEKHPHYLTGDDVNQLDARGYVHGMFKCTGAN